VVALPEIPKSLFLFKMIYMRKLSCLFVLLIFLSSCDDGDIIVTTFDFEEDTFSLCSEGQSKFLYHVKNSDIFETLTLQLNSGGFSPDDTKLVPSEETLRIPLSGNNEIIYRTYDAAVPAGRNAYFCTLNPPSSPRVVQEYQSVGGTVIIRTVEINGNFESLIEVENLQLQNQGPDGGDISFTSKVLGRFAAAAGED